MTTAFTPEPQPTWGIGAIVKYDDPDQLRTGKVTELYRVEGRWYATVEWQGATRYTTEPARLLTAAKAEGRTA